MNRRALAGTAALAVALAPATTAHAVPFNLTAEHAQQIEAAFNAAQAYVSEPSAATGTQYFNNFQPVAAPGQFTPSLPANPLGYQQGYDSQGRLVVSPAEGTFTSGFGPRWGSWHHGIDIGAPFGTPIRSVMDGVVVNAGPASGFGNWVVIQHANGEKTVYGHMQSYFVAVGQHVSAGQVIALVGSEGQSTGPHLHFEIKPDGVNSIDPVPWFAARGIFIS